MKPCRIDRAVVTRVREQQGSRVACPIALATKYRVPCYTKFYM